MQMPRCYFAVIVLAGFLSVLFGGTGCAQTASGLADTARPATVNTGSAQASDRGGSASPGKGQASFANAMQDLKPLGKIVGNQGLSIPVPGSTGDVSSSVDFSAAIHYARQLESYSLLVWRGGELLLEQYFNGFDAGLRANTASMHKSVMALLIAAAIEDGFIDNVDTPVGDYLEQWRNRPEGAITIEHFLHMSSGLTPLSLEGGLESPRVQFVYHGDNVRKTLMNMRLEVEPGSRFLYANTDSQILAMVIEAATRQPYAEYLSKRLWRRIGADDAYVWNYEADSFPRTYTTLMATAIDWLRVGLLIKDKGQIAGDQVISAALIDAMTAPSPANINYGWQLWLGNKYEAKRFYNDAKTGPGFVAKEPFAVDDMIYFDGIGGQRVYISRKADLVIVRTGEQRMDWDDSRLPNLVLDALKD